MTAAEKIQKFASIDDLLEEISNDINTNSVLNRRYAVRFILLDNFNLYQDFIKKMTKPDIQIFNLEQLLDSEDKDSWITTDALVNAIEKLKGRIVVSPFSEIVRFYKEEKFKALFEGMSLMELDPSTRIYIPLIGLKHRFEKFLNTFSRIKESQPIWTVYSEELQSVEIDLIPSDFPCPDSLNCLKNVYEWLVFWKTHAPTERILCSSETINTYSKYSQPDNIFDIKKIDTAYSFITQFLNIQIGIEYKMNDENFWIQLLSLLNCCKTTSFSFKSFVNKYFNIHNLTIENILNIWTSSNTKEFDRWLLKHYYLQNLFAQNRYLTDIIKDCVDYSSLRLFREVALSIFVDTSDKKSIEERNNLMDLFDKQYKLPDSDLSEIKEQILDIAKSDTGKAIQLCSGRFDFEKEIFIGWYKIGKMKNAELQNFYPDFAAYLSDIKYNNWANTYIQAYKQAKIEDKYTDEIKNFIIDKNANEEIFYEWYHNFELSKELLAKEGPHIVYWIDGLGIEYLSLIKSLIEQSAFKIEKLQIAKTGIPSSTEYNRFENCRKIDELDNFIHNNFYRYPETICKEIDIVKNIFRKILNQTTETTIIIVSDHGLTALSRLVDSKKYQTKSSHEGRYIKLKTSENIEDTDYIRHKNDEDNFKVALTHASLDTKPVREVHGGCTPEEILVPFIVISNKKETENVTVFQNIVEQEKTKEVVPKQQAVGFEEEDLF